MSNDRTEQFVRLLARHDREIYRYVLTLIGRRGEAEDVMQETAAALWRRFDEYDPALPFRAWAFRFAYFEVLAWRKRARRQPMFNDELVAKLADQRAEQQDTLEHRRAALTECMEQLPGDDRELLHQRYDTKETIADLARRTNRPAKKLYDALERVRRWLSDCVSRGLSEGGTS